MKNANTPTLGRLMMCTLIFLLCCCDEPAPSNCSPREHTDSDVVYNIYIENSGSMAGYLGNTSDFKKVLISFVSDIPALMKKEPKLFLVSGNVCPFQQGDGTPLVKSIMGLNAGTLRGLCPSDGSSLLPQIIDSCTIKMDEKVSILVSDCIFSDRSGSPTVLAEAELKLFMAKKLETERNISTIVIKYNSSFSGLYYAECKGGTPIRVNNINRPYYLLIFGRKENLAALLQKVDFKSYPGFEASYCLSANDSADAAYAVMTYENRQGEFESAKPPCLMQISEAKGIRGVFQFSFAADLSRLGYLDDYLLNPQSYVVNDGFSVVDVSKTNGKEPYNITLKTDHLLTYHSLKILIKYNIPSWITQTGNENDGVPTDSIQQHQTFGFKQLMNGIFQAYKASSPDHAFKLPLPNIVINR